MFHIKDFDSSLLKIDKKSYKNIGIYNIRYITIKKIDDYEIIHIVNPLYLMIDEVIGDIKQNNGSKYLVFDSTDEIKNIKKDIELWDGIKNKIEVINGGKTSEYGKVFLKIKFDSDDDLLLNKQIKFPTMTIVVRSVFEDDGTFDPKVYLDEL